MNDGVKRLTIKLDDKEVDLTREGGGLRAFFKADCPACKKKGPTYVGGKGMHIGSRDTYQADGVALCCMAPLGVITAYMSTLFGLEEDEAVLIRGRARVY